MVKPQFEVGRERLGDGGVVRSPDLHAEAVSGVIAAAADLGWHARAVVPSRLPGPSGNREFFLHLTTVVPAVAVDVAASVVAN
jgi:23S rRNA (cytidine1920-2'-O)/16S rRNA (cytidine1409-2'-O)-methyltransferase